MIFFAVYDKQTGRVTKVGSAPTNAAAIAQLVDDVNHGIATRGTQITAKGHYVDVGTGEILSRPAHGIMATGFPVKAFDGSPLRLDNVPAGAIVRVGATTYVADGTPVELFFYVKGAYRVQVDNFPTTDFEVDVHAD